MVVASGRVCAIIGGLGVLCSVAIAGDDASLFAEAVNELVSTEQLRSYHDELASEPHVAGSEGDWRTIERLAKAFESFGLTVEIHEFWAYLSKQGESKVEVMHGEEPPFALALRERPLDEDPDSAHPSLGDGWNAYSGSGDVSGEVVYANYGRLEDFEALAARGIDVRGRIVLARYGGNFRGFKAKYAQEAGAAGLLIYTDPADSGYVRGFPYPEGGWANESSIQRGSIVTLDQPGDPLTPFAEATEQAKRLDAQEVDLPRIPVQPIGWGAAHEIMARMTGERVPDSWQGGLPLTYRIEGGADLKVRLSVQHERAITKTANVIGELRGAVRPDEVIIVGCHHDSWGHGASDPLAGLICLLESARCFGELRASGWAPARTIRFAAWGAEEHGIIGSVEYVESRPEALSEQVVAYINLDMAATGPHFGASGTPSLADAVFRAAGEAPQARQAEKSALDAWSERTSGKPQLGELGGGSDHIGFLCHLCIPSVSLGAHGSAGTAYHSNYDTLAWYRKVVGEDYEPAAMVTRVTNALVARLSQSRVIPFDPLAMSSRVREHARALSALAEQRGLGVMVEAGFARLQTRISEFNVSAVEIMKRVRRAELNDDRADLVNDRLMGIERAWCGEGFDSGRPWFRNGYVSPDQTSGYAAWMLPALRHAIELEDGELVVERIGAYLRFFDRAEALLKEVEAALDEG